MIERLPSGILPEPAAGSDPSRTEDVKTALDLLNASPEARAAAQQPAAAGSPATAPQPATVSEVVSLLNAFRVLLLRRILRCGASGATVIPGVAPSGPAQRATAAPLSAGIHLELLTKTPQEIARDDILLQQLYSSVEGVDPFGGTRRLLGYLTSAFLRDETSSIASAGEDSAARRLRGWAMTTAVLGLLFFLRGAAPRARRSGSPRDPAARTGAEEYRLVVAAVDQRHDPDQLADCTKGLSEPQRQSNVGYQPWCERLRDVLQRMEIARGGLGAWNVVSIAWPMFCRSVGSADANRCLRVVQAQWDASELRASAVMAGLPDLSCRCCWGCSGLPMSIAILIRRVQTATCGRATACTARCGYCSGQSSAAFSRCCGQTASRSARA